MMQTTTRKYIIRLPGGRFVEGSFHASNYETFVKNARRMKQFKNLSRDAITILHNGTELDEAYYEKLLSSYEDPVELYLELNVAIYQAKMNSSSKKMDFSLINIPPQTLWVDSRSGFDEDFHRKATGLFKIYSTDKDKGQEKWELYGYDVTKQSYSHLTDDDMLKMLNVAVVFVYPHGYSSFSITELGNVVEFAGFGEDHVEALQCYANSEKTEAALYPDEECFAPFNMDRIVDYLTLSLSMISHVVKHLIESNRRLAINMFVIVVANMANMILDTEKEFGMMEEFRSPRHGTGPLDYFLEFDAEGAAANKKRFVVNSMADYKGRIETIYKNIKRTSNLPVSADSYVVTTVRDEPMVEDEESEDESTDTHVKGPPIPGEGVVEAKATDLTKVKDVSNGLGQLCAQMLDILKRKKKRSIAAATSSSSSSEEEEEGRVKGLLTTGQQSLFFILRNRRREDKKPLLEFKGRFAVKIFQNFDNDRNSGLGANEAIDEKQVEAYLKNLYYFLVHMA